MDDHINQRFYWDDGEKLLVYALPEEIVYADVSTKGDAGPLLKEKDGEAYLALGLVKIIRISGKKPLLPARSNVYLLILTGIHMRQLHSAIRPLSV